MTEERTPAEIISDIDQAVNGWPASFKLYKGMGGSWGAIQFDLTPKHKSKRDLGAVFIQMAAAIGRNEYDWDNKINFACGISDIAKILDIFRNPPPAGGEPVSIYHDTHAGTERKGETTKSLLIARGERNGFFFSLIEKSSSSTRSVKVPVSDGEAIVLRNLLERSCSRILGW
jgi:hypothetical protein